MSLIERWERVSYRMRRLPPVELCKPMYYQTGFTGKIYDQFCEVGFYVNIGTLHFEVYR